MATITIHTANTDQDTAIRLFLDALYVEYKSDEVDDTKYLLSTSANADHLKKSIEQMEAGEVTKVNLDDIWKP
ncbi:type II toxin-antitoxin system Phd/YefM family antitoxin [Mucilaginibacter arboris]|uniref:Uncharacterized protein n=1 Tax=Mucilaginibacter arboris TaxID=2682090 RepID=A0A7K1SWG4_9SPHI|nr:hypothetical protein [Mucilaginibacter arboris]MVN21587.1 hypothetical protein [Mucilaginibacter arboris]